MIVHAPDFGSLLTVARGHSFAVAVDVAFVYMTWPIFAAVVWLVLVAGYGVANAIRSSLGIEAVTCVAPAADLDLLGFTCLLQAWPIVLGYPLAYTVLSILAIGRTAGMRETGAILRRDAPSELRVIWRTMVWSVAVAIGTVVAVPVAFAALYAAAAPLALLQQLIVLIL